MCPRGVSFPKTSIKSTTRSRYAVTAMVELARLSDGNPVPLSMISQEGKISLSYLEQLFSALRKHKLVTSHRGPGGGYVLARDAKNISLSDIIVAAEESNQKEKQHKPEAYDNEQTKAVWDMTGHIFYSLLEKISLSDTLAGNIDQHPKAIKLFDALT